MNSRCRKWRNSDNLPIEVEMLAWYGCCNPIDTLVFGMQLAGGMKAFDCEQFENVVHSLFREPWEGFRLSCLTSIYFDSYEGEDFGCIRQATVSISRDFHDIATKLISRAACLPQKVAFS